MSSPTPLRSLALPLDCADHPFVSIIVCTVGLRPSLLRCLESLAAQGCARSEILVVLNREENVPLELPALAMPLRVLHEPRRGVCAARNRAIPEARGEILVFVDDDIVAHSGWLHALLEGFSDPQVACVTGRVIPEGVGYFGAAETNRVYFGPEALTSRTVAPDPGWCEWILRGHPFIGFGCNMAFRKQFLERCTPFPEDLGAGSAIGAADENYMFVQILKRGLKVHYTPQAAVIHVFESDPVGLKARAKQIYAANMAFNLKLLAEEKSLRWATLTNLLAGTVRFTRKALGSKSPDLLSTGDKLGSYWRGVWQYWRAWRARASAPTGHPRGSPPQSS